MKERLTLRNVVIWGAAFLGLVFFFLSFAATSSIVFTDSSIRFEYVFHNAIWSGSVIDVYANGQLVQGGASQGMPFALPIVGVILLLVAVLGAVAASFFLKKRSLYIGALIGCGVLAITGGIFVFFVGETGLRTFIYSVSGSLDNYEDLKAQMIAAGVSYGPRALAIIIGIVSILSGVAFGVAPFLPEKKLVK